MCASDLNLEDDFQGNSRYNAAARFILTELDKLGGELVTDVQIGSDPKVASEFYQPLNATRTWFVAPSLRIEARDLQLYNKDVEVADYRDREAEADFDIGRTLGNWGEIRVGYHRTNGVTRPCAWAIRRWWSRNTTTASCSSSSATTDSTICIFPAKDRHSPCSGTPIAPTWAPILLSTKCRRIG